MDGSAHVAALSSSLQNEFQRSAESDSMMQQLHGKVGELSDRMREEAAMAEDMMSKVGYPISHGPYRPRAWPVCPLQHGPHDHSDGRP